MRSSDVMRAAIIGAGLMGRWHADAATRAKAEIVLVHDRDEARAKELARKTTAACGADLDALLDRTSPDVAHVCTPLESHVPLARELLRRKIHLVVEKPLATTAADTHTLLEEARAADRVLCPVHQTIFQRWPSLITGIGEILSIDHVTCSAGASSRAAQDLDRLVEEVLPHPLSIFEHLQPGSTEHAFSVVRPRPGELSVQVEHRGAVLRTSISALGRPTRHELRIIGTQGSLYADLFHGYSSHEGEHDSRAYKIARPFVVASKRLTNAGVNLGLRALRNEHAYPGLRELVAAVYDQIRGGPIAIDPARVLAVAAARDRILGPASIGGAG